MSAGQLRVLKSRIKSVDNTKKITRAMEMVSAAKLRRFQATMSKARPYTNDLEAMLGRLVEDQAQQNQKGSSDGYSHPLLSERPEKNIGVIVITSDTGLCGSYNTELIEMGRQYLGEKGQPAALIGIGKSGVSALSKSGYNFDKVVTDIKPDQVEATIKDLKAQLEELYTSEKVDAVYVIYSHFVTATASKPLVEKILPLKKPEKKEGEEEGTSVRYIYEPTPEIIFEKLIPTYFEAKVRMILLESFVSEHMARMNAMHQATKNASEMIDSLILVRNKIRQAIITKEIIEIVSGSQALKN